MMGVDAGILEGPKLFSLAAETILQLIISTLSVVTFFFASVDNTQPREKPWGQGWITPSSICLILLIIHSKYFPDSDWLKAHA